MSDRYIDKDMNINTLNHQIYLKHLGKAPAIKVEYKDQTMVEVIEFKRDSDHRIRAKFIGVGLPVDVMGRKIQGYTEPLSGPQE